MTDIIINFIMATLFFLIKLSFHVFSLLLPLRGLYGKEASFGAFLDYLRLLRSSGIVVM